MEIGNSKATLKGKNTKATKSAKTSSVKKKEKTSMYEKKHGPKVDGALIGNKSRS